MMTENTKLIERREELKSQIQRGEYKLLVNVILDGTGRLIQKLTRNPDPMPLWYSLAVIDLVTLLAGASISLLLRETYSFDVILLGIWGLGLGISGMVVVRATCTMLFSYMHEIGIDAMASIDDLDDLQRRLAAGFNLKKLLLLSLAFGLLFAFSIPAIWVVTRGVFIGFGPIIISLILGFQGSIPTAYIVGPGLTLPGRLSRYQFKLYAVDPRSSEVIAGLSDLFSNTAYLGAVYIAAYTFGIVALRLPPVVAIIYVVLPGWGLLIAFFVSTQYMLAKIITRAKWKTLNGIQAEIERLQAQGKITNKETMETINRLMDYHNRIKATPDSALDFRGGLNFLNSLLLPVIAFVLANLDKIIALFSN